MSRYPLWDFYASLQVAGTAAPAAVGLNGEVIFSTNTSGRAIGSDGSDPATDVTNLSTITDNPGVGIFGFSSYRVRYDSDNDGYGFLEGGDRLEPTAAFDGGAFSNSSAFATVSDLHTVVVNIGDQINFSYAAGSDSGTSNFRTFLHFNDGSSVEVGAVGGANITGTASPRISGSHTATNSYTSVGIYVIADSAGNPRSLVDQVFLETVVPKPSSALLVGLGALGLIRRRR